MKLRSLLVALALLAAPGSLRAQDSGLAPLQSRSEKLAAKTGAAVVGLGQKRPGRTASVAEMLDAQAGGAGFLIDQDGRILTASSLVPGAGRIEVYFKGHHRAMATVVARDPRTHTALLQLSDVPAVLKELGRDKLPVLELGRSSDLRLGRVVATVGNPYSSIQTDGDPAFSLGVVSALGRVRDADNYKGEAIETDAAVNPGSFGGPLVDLNGRAVGIVIEPYSTKRWFGVAVPIDEVAPILDDLKAGRTPAPPHLGLSVKGASEATLDGLPVSNVEEGGPAAKAGVKTGDVLLTLDGTRVVEAFDLERELGLLSQGTPVELGLLRDGKKIALHVTLGAAKVENVATATPPPSNTETTDAPRADGKPFLGINVEEKDDGLYVSKIVEGGPASEAKLSVGVKVVSFNGQSVTKKQEIVDALSKLSPGDKVTLKVENAEGFHKTVTIVLGTKGAPRTEERPDESKPKKSKRPAFMGLGVGQAEDEDAPGLVVSRVMEGSPAEKAKIKEGDLVLEIDGKKMTDFDAFTKAIRSHAPGDVVKVKISRGGAEKEVSVTLGERPAELDQQHPQPQEEDEKGEEKPAPKKPWAGFAAVEKNGKVLVDEVAPGGPAEAAKLKAGMAVVGAEGEEKITIDRLAQMIEAKKIGDKLTLKVENDEGWTKTVTLVLGERPKDK